MSARALLRDLAQEEFVKLNEMIDGPVRQLMPASLVVWDDSEEHRRWIVTIRDTLRSTMTDETLKRVRNKPAGALSEWLSSVDGIRFVFQGINSRLGNAVPSLCLASSPSVNASFVSGLAAVAIHWLAFGGLEAAAPAKSTNDLLDIEYATLGSLSVSLLSDDKRLNGVCQAIRTATGERQSWFRDRGWERT